MKKDKFFNPYVSSFKAFDYSNILSLSFLSKSNDYLFAKVFWIDIIDNISLSSLNESATAFWGRHGMAGQVSGDTVENYIKWHVCNQEGIIFLLVYSNIQNRNIIEIKIQEPFLIRVMRMLS
jgi:hypothetical protein